MSSEDKDNKIVNENKDITINNNEINNNNNLSYKKDLWMHFESINTKFVKDRQKAKFLMYIISQKSILAEEYSNNLDLLYNQFFIELNYFLEEDKIKNKDKKYILDNFLNTYLENIKNESILFRNYSKLVKNKILKNLEQNIQVQYEMNSQLNELYKTYEEKFKSVIQNLTKYKDDYEKAGKLVEKSKKDYEIMKEEIENQKEKNEANELKYKKCKEENIQKTKEAKNKQKKYEDYIAKANKEREKYIELSEKTYDLAEKLDKEYINLIKNNMSSLLNAQNDLFNIIIQENKNMVTYIDKIDFYFELEEFSKLKFPKYSPPKPFTYEQYTPYLFLRDRNKTDFSNAKNPEIYKNIVNDLNHLFISSKYKLNSKIKNGENNKDNTNENKENNSNDKNKINIEDFDTFVI